MKGLWLTSKGDIEQDLNPNRFITKTNQLLYCNGTTYLIPRNTITDGYTIPFGINKTKWDIRPASLHDIGCRYHSVIIVDLPLNEIYEKFLELDDTKTICKDIPKEYLRIKSLTFNQVNDLLLYGMDCLKSIPKFITELYRTAVNLNLKYPFNKYKLDITILYNNKLYT